MADILIHPSNGIIQFSGSTTSGSTITVNNNGNTSWNHNLNSTGSNGVFMEFDYNGNPIVELRKPTDTTSLAWFSGSLHIVGDRSTPNTPTTAGIYIGMSQTDDNRRIEMVAESNGATYIDFTRINTDFRGRLLYNANDELIISASGSNAVTISGTALTISRPTTISNNLTSTETITGDTIVLANDATNTFRHRISVYDQNSSSYGMMLWNSNGTAGAWSTMLYTAGATNRRISFGKVNNANPTTHAHVTEGAYFDTDDWSLNLTGELYTPTTVSSSLGRFNTILNGTATAQLGGATLTSLGKVHFGDNSAVVGTGSYATSSIIMARSANEHFLGFTRTGIRTWTHGIRSDGSYVIKDADTTTAEGSSRLIINSSSGYVAVGSIVNASPASSFHVYQNTTDSGSATGITIEQQGTGDAQLQLLLTGTQRYVVGIDNSDGDKLKIGSGLAWGVHSAITVSPTSALVGIAETSPTYNLDVGGTLGIRVKGTGDRITLDGTGTLDSADAWILMGNGDYNWRVGYQGTTSGADGNEFKVLSIGNLGTGRYFQFDHDGNFEISGSLNVTGVSSLTSIVTSDLLAGNVSIIGNTIRNNSSNLILQVTGSADIRLGAPTNNRVVIYNIDNADTDAVTPKLSLFAVENLVTGFSIQKVNTGAWGRGRFALLQHDANDYTTETEVFSILPNGNVGILETNPSVNLHVGGSGDVRLVETANNLTSNIDPRGIQNIYGDAQSVNYTIAQHGGTATNGIMFQTGQSGSVGNRMFIRRDGLVGIGTTTPTQLLDVNGQGRFAGSLTVQSSNYVQIQVDQTDSGKITMGVTSNTSQGFINAESSGSFTPEFRVLLNTVAQGSWTTTGLGIGTTTPSFKLDVNGDARVTGTVTASVLNAPTANIGTLNVTNNSTLNDVTVQGNLTVLGGTFSASVETVLIQDNILVINDGETGAGVTNGFAGIEVDRGSATEFHFLFRESDDRFVVGTSGSLQVVATRMDDSSMTAFGVPFYNDTAKRFDTDSNLLYSASIVTLNGRLNIDNLRLDGNTISSVSGNVEFSPYSGLSRFEGQVHGGNAFFGDNPTNNTMVTAIGFDIIGSEIGAVAFDANSNIWGIGFHYEGKLHYGSFNDTTTHILELQPSGSRYASFKSDVNITGSLVLSGSALTLTGSFNQLGTGTVNGIWDVDNLRLDGNTISSTNSNGNIIVSPNGTGIVDINSSVVIGESTTPYSLTIYSSTTAGLVLHRNGNPSIQFTSGSGVIMSEIFGQSTGGIRFRQNNTSATDFFIDNAGNVGIKSATPTLALDVAGSIGGRGASSNSTWTSAGQVALKNSDSQPYISFHYNDGTRQGWIQVQSGSSFILTQQQNHSMEFRTNNTTRWTISNGGLLESTGAQTIRTSTGDLTLATNGANGNIFIQPNGTGQILASNTAHEIVLLGTPDSQTGIVFNANATNNRSRFDFRNYSNATEGSRTFFIGYQGQTGINIQQNGNVGIGLATQILPTTTLDVNGTGRFNGNVTVTGSVQVSGSMIVSGSEFNILRLKRVGSINLGATILYENSNGYQVTEGLLGTNTWTLFSGSSWTANTNILLADPVNKRLGIGEHSTIPSAMLHVRSTTLGGNGSAISQGILIENLNSSTGESAVVFRNTGSVGTGTNYWFTGLNQATRYQIGYGTEFTDGVTYFVITTEGRVGLGTGNVNPTGSLHIIGTSSPLLTLEDTSAGSDSDIRFVPVDRTRTWTLGIDDSDSDKFKLSYSTALGTNDVITVTTGSTAVERRVGINNSSPTHLLDVNGTGRFSGNVTVTGSFIASGSSHTIIGNTSVDSGTLTISRGGNTTYNIIQAEDAISLNLGQNGTSNRGYLRLWGNVAGSSSIIQTTTNNLHLDTSGSSAGNILLQHYGTGNVVVGTTGTSTSKFNVNGDALVTTNLKLTQNSSMSPNMFIGGNTLNDNIYIIQFGTSSTNQLGMGYYTSSRGMYSRAGLGIHVSSSMEFSIKSTGWDNLFAVQGGTGNFVSKGQGVIRGGLEVTGSVTVTGSTALFNNSYANPTTALHTDNNLQISVLSDSFNIFQGISFRHSSLQNRTAGASIVHERTGANSWGHLHFLTRTADADASPLAYVASADRNQNFTINNRLGVGYTAGSTLSDVLNVNGTSRLIGDLTVTGSVTTVGSSNTTQITSQGNTDVDTGASRVIATVPTGSFDSAFFNYVIKKSTNLRAGTVMAIWSGTTVEFTEFSTKDIGSTADVVLSVDVSGGNARLLAVVQSNDWIIKSQVTSV